MLMNSPVLTHFSPRLADALTQSTLAYGTTVENEFNPFYFIVMMIFYQL